MSARASRSRWAAVLRTRELSTLFILLAEIAFFAWYLWPDGGGRHPFVNAENGLLILKYSAIYGIAAVGASMVIISGGVDLAPGAVIALISRSATSRTSTKLNPSLGTPGIPLSSRSIDCSE